MSQRSTPTEAGDVNRKTSEDMGRRNSGTGSEFGQNIGRSENLEGEGGEMDRNKNKDMNENESSRRSSGESGYGSSSGRSSGSLDNVSEKERSSSIGSGSRRGSSGSMENDDSSSGRH